MAYKNMKIDIVNDMSIVPSKIVEYYLNEAASGTDPVYALDSGTPTLGDPVDLTINYLGHLEYTTSPSGRGLYWSTINESDNLINNTDFSKIYSNLNGSHYCTIEMVVDIDTADSDSWLICLSSSFCVALTSSSEILIETVNDIDGVIDRYFYFSSETAGQVTIHCVCDFTQAVETDRVKFFVDGVRADISYSDTTYTQNASLVVPASFTFTIGGFGPRNMQGSIYYASIYNEAFSDTEITERVSYLSTNNDSVTTTAINIWDTIDFNDQALINLANIIDNMANFNENVDDGYTTMYVNDQFISSTLELYDQFHEIRTVYNNLNMAEHGFTALRLDGEETKGLIIDHGDNQGLLDDDHQQYLRADGYRAMSGDLDLDGYDLLNAHDGYFENKLTVGGLIDPTGIVLEVQSSVPGGTPPTGKATLWVRDVDGYVVLTDDNGIDKVLMIAP